jgi:hypothetical protein
MSQQYQKQKQKWKQQGREEAISEFKEKLKELKKKCVRFLGTKRQFIKEIDKTAQEIK